MFLILGYGDYPPASKRVVETIYFGVDHLAGIESLKTWPFHGGAPIRNALHEGIASCLEVWIHLWSFPSPT